MQNDWHSITLRWLRRLRFSLLAIAFVLGWEAYKRYQAGIGNDWRTLLFIVGAMLSFVLALSGRDTPRRDE
ncbi:MAG TPA: hypothetical protein VLJ39_21545 [Tepidisphaeraceae bacterium]|jgi:hypothetical protein|nr:hypothetical protein [Tepidisphaeraceae bacterium]